MHFPADKDVDVSCKKPIDEYKLPEADFGLPMGRCSYVNLCDQYLYYIHICVHVWYDMVCVYLFSVFQSLL